ncbi:MAG: UDP-N-acetylglucosamine--N-acetylmuramyl-(pentapeptide) pyrophosphoryl-undecaprenol N-acetylglucosamine transferase [Pyrinomonadaceae bacterium]|jgi:UDP-N-acetylglucosamine--N-acetylmuramyl-(pentapeptide) pyrophosphoryl-undecaprenol N-acetylglucosamine transferase|nr:MAG: UDP-N-acetylglucosamine--N-acetylmuramyl-(pentapeptide) pyrophosphoryl-undecaprenol N-acetylglucosamine transferase [Pyrinomonadaceae bacterium]
MDCEGLKVLIAAGGTGGHIYPGIAVAREIQRCGGIIRFVGTRRGLEARIVPENGFEISFIESLGLKSVGFWGKLKGILVLPKSFLQAWRLLREFKPDVVVGAGGYVSGPVLMMAYLMGFPTLVIEQNALPGFTNRVLAWFVKKAALTFEEATLYFGKKAVVTGNPVRREFFEIKPKSRDKDLISVLIFGGSQGARAINDAVIEALPYLEKYQDKLKLTHQTGEKDYERVLQAYQATGWKNYEIFRYIQDMPKFFAEHDLIVSRAGATTCAELAAAGKASIMIPLPTAADDHQRKNAEAFQRAGATQMILQKDLSGKVLAEKIIELADSPQKITEMEKAVKRFAKPDAAEAVAKLILELGRKKR